MNWIWKNETPHEQAEAVRAHAKLDLRFADLCRLFNLTAESAWQIVVKGDDWCPEYDMDRERQRRADSDSGSVSGGVDMNALRFTDEQLALLRELAAPLAPSQRSAFLEDVARRLNGVELGDGTVARSRSGSYFDQPQPESALYAQQV